MRLWDGPPTPAVKTSRLQKGLRVSAGRLLALAGLISWANVPPPQSTPLDLIESGKGLKFQAERPHLVSLGSGRLSVAITLLPLPEGETGGAAASFKSRCFIVDFITLN